LFCDVNIISIGKIIISSIIKLVARIYFLKENKHKAIIITRYEKLFGKYINLLYLTHENIACTSRKQQEKI
jgi:hypothetical protein